MFGFLITGAVLVEYTFGLNGLGALLIQAVRTKDFAVVQAVTLLFTVAFILINLVVDLLYAVDRSPRAAPAEGGPDGDAGRGSTDPRTGAAGSRVSTPPRLRSPAGS